METTKLKQVDEDSIIQTIVELMNKVECVLDMSGLDKKNYVLNEIKKYLDMKYMNAIATSLLHL